MWNNAHKDDLYNMLVHSNGDNFTNAVLYEVEQIRNSGVSPDGMIVIHRHFIRHENNLTETTKLVDVGITGEPGKVNVARAKELGYKVEPARENSMDIYRTLKYSISDYQFKGYIRYLGEVLTEKYQARGNDVVEAKDDMIVIMQDVKNVMQALRGR